MRNINDYIVNESSDWELDDSVSKRDKRKVQQAIYKEIEKTNSTGRFYHDTAWEGVGVVRKDIQKALLNLYARTEVVDHSAKQYEVSIAPDNGGYRKSKDGMSQWKQYKVEIFVKGAEIPFMRGTLNCHAAGSQDDPFDTYDMSLVISY